MTEPLNEDFTTTQGVVDAEGMLATFADNPYGLAPLLAAADRNTLMALLLYADRAIVLAAERGNESPQSVRQSLRLVIAGIIADETEEKGA